MTHWAPQRFANETGSQNCQLACTSAPVKLARVDVHANVADALPVWEQLEAACPATFFQTRRFVLPWLATAGAHVTPLIVVGYDQNGAPALLLPLGIAHEAGLNVAGFLGGRMSNGNCGLIRPDLVLTADDLRGLLAEAGRRAAPRPDAYALLNQLPGWDGQANPFAILPHQASASLGHGAKLLDDPAQFMKLHLSGPAARKLRNKRQKLAALGRLEYRVAQGAGETATVLAAFLDQKVSRLRAQGIRSEFEMPEIRAFLEQACSSTGEMMPAVELHGLFLDDAVVAVYGGGQHGAQFHALFNSFDPNPDIARHSPGDLLAQELIAAKCRAGVTYFDFGIGEARYKDMWCDEALPLFDTFLATNLRGRLFGLYASLRNTAKRQVKQNARVWAILKRVRAA